MPEIVTRSGWGARAPKRKLALAKPEQRTEFMGHYSTGDELRRDDSYQWTREIQRFHQDSNGWDDIGYAFTFDKAGLIFEGRGWLAVGAHCPGHNTSAVGVCYLGDDDPSYLDLTHEAKVSFKWLYEQSKSVFGRTLTLLGHRDGKATACPGNEFYAWIKAGLPLDAATVPIVTAPVVTSLPFGPPAPFPLPGGWYFGPKAGPKESVSGFYHKRSDGHRGHDGLMLWQTIMRRRGWNIDADGLYGPQTEHVTRLFQQEKGLAVDGLIGPITWGTAWTADITA